MNATLSPPPIDPAAFADNASEVAGILALLGNTRRLMVMCKLAEFTESPVNQLAEAVGLSQSALSQHLAKLRDAGLVAPRRDGQTIFYRIADPRCETLMALLHELYCREQER